MRTVELLKKYKIRLKKSLGQNFLSDERIAKRIVGKLDLTQDDLIIEIGAGAGTLTEELLKSGAFVVSFEIDKRLKDLLESRLGRYKNVQLIFEDFLKFDLTRFGKDVIYIGNIPYHITSAIFEKILLNSPGFKYAVLMVQREIAERVLSKGKSRNFSSLSVLVNYFCRVEKLFDVSKSHFIPNPNVDSSVLKLAYLNERKYSVDDIEKFLKFVRGIFTMRRKKIRTSLKMIGYSGIINELERMSISYLIERRVEELDVFDLIKLFNTLEEIGNERQKN